MLVCPLDYRYGRDEVKRIFSEESKLRYMLMAEAALAAAQAEVGDVPEWAAEGIKGAVGRVSLDRVKEIEAEIKHDVMAVARALAEAAGEAGKYVHLGATSNDIIDTATALQLREFFRILEEDFIRLEDALIELVRRYAETPMLGRTHGQAAVPVTFGLKAANWLAEVHRDHIRFREAYDRIAAGKFLGATGTGAALGERAPEIQKRALSSLGVKPDECPTQIVGRDRYAEFVSLAALTATTLERVATEIRNLQRTEIGEVSEHFDEKKQVGSSTMAHKRNPILCENVCSLARVIRGFLIPTYENMVLWHERDLTNSAAERFILPHVAVLLDDIMVKMERVIRTLHVNEERMRENLLAHPEVTAEALIMALVGKGLGRNEAHEMVRAASVGKEGEAWVRSIMNSNIREYLSEEELKKILNPLTYIGHAPAIAMNVVRQVLGDRRVRGSE